MTELPIAYVPDPLVAELIGPVPGLRIVTDTDGAEPVDAVDAAIYVPRFLAAGSTTEIVSRMPRLRLLQLATAGAEVWLDTVPPGVSMATARGAHGGATAEWAVGALLAVLREFPGFVNAQREQRWTQHATDWLGDQRVLVVGAGDLGDNIRTRLLAFDAGVTMVGRTARDGVHAFTELPVLLPGHGAVILVVPLTEETFEMVNAEFLAAMPDRAVLVNAARGQVVDTDALVAELTAGRLRAALDVTEPEPLPPGHPLWNAPGVFITPHVGGSVTGSTQRAAEVVAANLRRFVAGEPLHNLVGSHGY